MKWRVTDWKKTFAKFISDKGHFPDYIKNSYNSMGINNPIF